MEAEIFKHKKMFTPTPTKTYLYFVYHDFLDSNRSNCICNFKSTYKNVLKRYIQAYKINFCFV